jgi:hypothetical protein
MMGEFGPRDIDLLSSMEAKAGLLQSKFLQQSVDLSAEKKHKQQQQQQQGLLLLAFSSSPSPSSLWAVPDLPWSTTTTTTTTTTTSTQEVEEDSPTKKNININIIMKKEEPTSQSDWIKQKTAEKQRQSWLQRLPDSLVGVVGDGLNNNNNHNRGEGSEDEEEEVNQAQLIRGSIMVHGLENNNEEDDANLKALWMQQRRASSASSRKKRRDRGDNGDGDDEVDQARLIRGSMTQTSWTSLVSDLLFPFDGEKDNANNNNNNNNREQEGEDLNALHRQSKLQPRHHHVSITTTPHSIIVNAGGGGGEEDWGEAAYHHGQSSNSDSFSMPAVHGDSSSPGEFILRLL